MKKYLIASATAAVLLVGCSNNEAEEPDGKTEAAEVAKETQVVNPVVKPVEPVKPLSEQEKKQLDYNEGAVFIEQLDEHYKIYRDMTEAKRYKGNDLDLTAIAMQIETKLEQYTYLENLYDKEYESKLNEYLRLFSDAINKIKLATYSSHLYETGKGDVDTALFTHDEYIHSRDALYEKRDELIDYHNEKYKE